MAEEKLNTTEDEISLKDLILKLRDWWKYLWSKWLIILMAGIIGGALGLTYAIIKKPVYTAETTFVLEDGDQGGVGIGQYAGIASMVGIDLGGGGGGIFKGDNILELYKSRRMIQEALLTIDTSENKKQLLIDRYINFNNLREKWEDQQNLKDITFFQNPSNFTRTQDSIISKIVSDINKNYLKVGKPDKKLSIISVKVNSKDEAFAKAFADNIVKTVNKFYVDTKTKKSAENLQVLQHQADSIRNVLNNSIAGVAIAVDANPNTNLALQTLKVPSQKKQLDVQANAAAYQEILKNLEIAKISFRQDQPLIQVIDRPIFPLLKEKTSKILALSIGTLMSTFLIIIYLCINKILKNE